MLEDSASSGGNHNRPEWRGNQGAAKEADLGSGEGFSDLFAQWGEIGVVFGRICPTMVDADGGLDVGACLFEIAELAVIAAELKFDMGVLGKLLFGFEKDGATVLDGVLMADRIGKGNPGFGLLGALAVKFLCRLAKFDKAPCGTEDAGAQEGQGKCGITLCAELIDSAKSFVVHPQPAVALEFFLQFEWNIHSLS